MDFTLEPVEDSRFYDPGDPVDPLLPAPGPFLYSYELPESIGQAAAVDAARRAPAEPSRFPDDSAPAGDGSADTPAAPAESPEAMDDQSESLGLPVQPVPEEYWDEIPRQCLVRMLEFESVRGEYRMLHGEPPPGDALDPSPKLSLRAIIELGLMNSREHQSEREQLYVSALSLTLERFDYTTKFTPSGNGAEGDYVSERDDGEIGNLVPEAPRPRRARGPFWAVHGLSTVKERRQCPLRETRSSSP